MIVADLFTRAMHPGRFMMIIALLLLILLAAPSAVFADEGEDDTDDTDDSWYEGWNFSGSESFEYRYNDELFNAGEENQYRSLLDAYLTKGRVTIGLSLNLANFFPREPYREFNDFAQVDRLFIDYAGDKFYGVAGDFFTTFERGMTLSVRHDPLIFLDNTIRGARASMTFTNFEFDLLGGFVDDKVTDEQDWIGGLRAAFILPRDIRIGVSGVYSDDKTDDWIEGEHILGSIFLDAPGLWDHLDFYGEYAVKDSELEPSEELGHGLYMAATYYHGEFTLLTEYKDYERIKYEYNNPPNADRLDEFFAPDNTRGFRVQPSYFVGKTGTDLSVSYSRFENLLNGSIVHHLFGGIEQEELFDRVYLQLQGGIRSEKNGKDEDKAILSGTIDVFEADSIIFDGLIKYARDPFYCNTEIESSLGYSFSGKWILSVLYQYSEVPVWNYNNFWGGELTANITESLRGTLFVGMLKGGQVCSGGQCRYEDPFKGAKLSLIYRF